MQSDVLQPRVMEPADVEFAAELSFGAGAQFANFELADLVCERLSGPYDIAIDLNGDVLIGLSGIVLEKLNGLFPAPTHAVHTSVHDQSHGAPHFIREL